MWIFFILFMIPVLFMMTIMVPFFFLYDILTAINTGFIDMNLSAMFMGTCSLIIAISIFVPIFRKIYDKLPWLYTFVRNVLIDDFILTMSVTILNHFYDVQNSSRHMIGIVLMIVFIAVSRILMSFYFKVNPGKFVNEE